MLLVCFLIAAFVHRTVTDTAYAVRGKTPPRHQVRLAQLAAARGGARPPLRHSAAAYFSDVWHDSWDDARERRQRVRARRAEKRAAQDTAVAAAPAAEPTRTPVVHAPAVPDAPPPAAPAEPAPGTAPPAGAVDLDAISSNGHTPVGGGAAVAGPESREPTPATDPTITEGSTTAMSTSNGAAVSGETISLPAAISYVEAMAERTREGVTSTEQSIGHLQAGKVEGQPLTDLSSAQEALSTAAAAFEAAASALREQLAVREAYEAAPHAGDKEFVTGD